MNDITFTVLNSIACVLLFGLVLYLLGVVSRLERDLDYTRFVALRRPTITIDNHFVAPVPVAEIPAEPAELCSECRECCPSDCQCWCHGIKQL